MKGIPVVTESLLPFPSPAFFPIMSKHRGPGSQRWKPTEHKCFQKASGINIEVLYFITLHKTDSSQLLSELNTILKSQEPRGKMGESENNSSSTEP